MFFRILKRDLKRKKSMNVILLLFIILATMFVASGLYNVLTVANGTNYYFKKANVPDVTILTSGDDACGHMEKILKEDPQVESFGIENVVFVAPDKHIFVKDHIPAEAKNTLVVMSIDSSKLNLFNSENERITEVEEGHVYLSGKFDERNDLQIGDIVNIDYEGVDIDLIFDGRAKDVLFGSDFVGNTRVIVNQKDYDKFLESDTIRDYFQGELGYVFAKDDCALDSVVAKIPSVGFSASEALLRKCYVMEMVVAFVVLILSICLILVSFVVLKFSINFTIQEEFREIGVMKAIGISNTQIRCLYLGKYLMLAIVGAVVGLAVSFPFSELLIGSVSANMVLGDDLGMLINLLGAVIVVAFIVGFAYKCTNIIKKSSPLDAIRNGQTGERYQKKTIYRMGKSHVSAASYLSINDVLSSPKRFLTVVISFFICTLFVLVLVNTVNTMESDSLIDTFSGRSDLYVTETDDLMRIQSYENRENFAKYLDERAKELTDMGMPSKMFLEIQYKYKTYVDDQEYSITYQQGINNTIDYYKFTKGVAPQNGYEVAITPVMANKLGIDIGDKITIDFGTEKRDCLVTGYFESMNQLGEIIRLHDDAPTDFAYLSACFQTQINFTDNPTDEEIQSRKARIKELYDNEKVYDAVEYCIDCIGVSSTMKLVRNLLLVITLLVVLLVTVLMEKTFIADEKSQIAILKAMGFKDKVVIRWHATRFGIVALISVVLAALVSIPVTDVAVSPIFGMMGTSNVDFVYKPLEIFVMYPAVILVFTAMIASITALGTKAITCRDTANIE